jgi:ribosomal protein S18 acetylase RimI-like enzyme
MVTALSAIISHPRVWLHPRFLAALRSRMWQGVRSTERAEQSLSLVGIAVSPEFTRRGVGAALMEAFEREALVRGYGMLRLSVYESNTRAIQLYRRFGWSPVGRSGPLVTYEKVMR